jgi:hypothetical protein
MVKSYPCSNIGYYFLYGDEITSVYCIFTTPSLVSIVKLQRAVFEPADPTKGKALMHSFSTQIDVL